MQEEYLDDEYLPEIEFDLMRGVVEHWWKA